MDALVIAIAADPETVADPFCYDPQFRDVNAETRPVMQNHVNAGVRAKCCESENIKKYTLVIRQP